MAADASVRLFDPSVDTRYVSVSRSGEARNSVAKVIEGSSPGTEAFPLRYPTETIADDFTASLYVGDRISARGPRVADATSVHVRLKGIEAPSVLRLTLVEKDGSAWSTKVFASPDWEEVVVPLSTLRAAQSAMVPQAYPGTWSYWLSPPPGRTSIDLSQVERLQFSLRKSDFGTIQSVGALRASIAIESASLHF